MYAFIYAGWTTDFFHVYVYTYMYVNICHDMYNIK